MDVVVLALKTLLRRKMRTALTVVGVSIGVAGVVALVSVSRGLRGELDQFFAVQDAHLVVTRKGAADPFISYLPDTLLRSLARHDAVASAHPFLFGATQIPDQPMLLTFGVDAGSPFLANLTVVEGDELSAAGAPENPLLLGARGAQVYGLAVGDTFALAHGEYVVVGLYESALQFIDAGGLLLFPDAQREAGLEGKMSSALLRLKDGAQADPQAVEEALEAAFPNLEATAPARFTDAFDEFDLMSEAVFAISILATFVGGIGVMNTMLMSVFERTREIGVLQAVGWSRGRILRLVLCEAAALCLVAAPVGLAIGIAGVEALSTVGHLSWMSGSYGPGLLLWAMGVGLGMGLVGAAYPAWRAARILPVEALRYE